MKVLFCHNYYQRPGGEDQVFADEARLLQSRGHTVVQFTMHNDAVGAMRKAAIAVRTLWNSASYADLRQLIRRERPDVMHCHNTFPLMSPSVYYAARAERVPVVQTLHNYRLICPRADFTRSAGPCEQCVARRWAWPAVRYRCYRDSRAASAVVAGMLAFHRVRRTWSRRITLYCALTEFARKKFVQAGWPEDKIVVKPNFVLSDAGAGSGDGGYAVFVGRLSPEKGVRTLLEAWRSLQVPIALKIVGDGPLQHEVRRAANGSGTVEWLGQRPHEEVLGIIGRAACLIMPSVWYETFGRTMIEAYCRGTPVIASRLGAMAELVDDGRTGRLFAPGDSEDLAEKVAEMLAGRRPPAAMREAARAEFEAKYTADINYRQLCEMYNTVTATVV